jgi:hypothetical protein
MSAPLGNQFWKARSSQGRDPIFATPDALWGACSEYFEWVDANPLYEARPFAYQGEVKVENIARMRAMTISGLCIFLGIARRSWDNYCERDGFGDVTARVEAIIRTQKFEGAAADLLNTSIIARELGLADKSEVTGKGGAALTSTVDELSKNDIARRVAFLLAQGLNSAAE